MSLNINPKNIQFLKDLTKDSYSDYTLDNTFCLFNSIDDILYLTYATKNKSIIFYDLISEQKINEIKQAHKMLITNFRHYFDKINQIDLIITISSDDNTIKLWKVYNMECLANIQNINENGKLYSACFLSNKNQNYIITTHYRKYLGNISEPIKVYDFNGNKIKEIKDSNDRTCFIDTFYDNESSKSYIITGNYNYSKSYVYNENKIYHIYNNNDQQNHYSIIISIKKGVTQMFESSEDGNIRIWNFHSGILLKKIKIGNDCLFGIVLWNNEYLFIGCEDKTIELIELDKGINVKNLIKHRNNVLTIKTIIHPKYGKCLISQGFANDQIKLWGIKN